MIRKTIIGLLVLATVGTVVLWALAFFSGPYTTEWSLTARIFVRIKIDQRFEFFIAPKAPAEVRMAQFQGPEGAPWLDQWASACYQVQNPPTILGFAWKQSDPFQVGPSKGLPITLLLVPLWAPLLLFTFPAVVLIRNALRRRARLRNGCCKKCGYDLQGNISGVCPECGKPTSTTT